MLRTSRCGFDSCRPGQCISISMTQSRVTIDYIPGTFGVFLCYVVNVYIMGVKPVNGSIFTANGIAHGVGYHQDYVKNRIVKSAPQRGQAYEDLLDSDQIVRIVARNIDDEWAFKLMTNFVIRVDDRGFDGYMQQVDFLNQQSRQSLRQFWYEKIVHNLELHEPLDFYDSRCFRPVVEKNLFEFSYRSFFSMTEFFKELYRLSCFLGFEFSPSTELAALWKEFNSKNHAVLSHDKCREILENILLGQDFPIDCTIMEEAWLNYNLSKIYQIYTGPVFDCDTYATNTKEIYDWIAHHAT